MANTVNTVIITSGTGTWFPPADCPVGTLINIGTWAGGAGGSGNAGSGHWGASGGGGTFANNFYVIQTSDVVSGIAYNVGVGSVGTSGADPVNGGNTSFGVRPKNWVPNGNGLGVIVNQANSLPYGWDVLGFLNNNVTPTIISQGTVTPTTGTCAGIAIPYVDIQVTGTMNSGNGFQLEWTNNNEHNAFGSVPVGQSKAMTSSLYIAITNGIANYNANASSFTAFFHNYFFANGNFDTNTTGGALSPALGTTLQQYQFNDTTPASANGMAPQLAFTSTQGQVINFTMRVAGIQLEQNTTATVLQFTPTSYVYAVGASHSVGNTAAINLGQNPAMQSFGSFINQGGNGANADGNADSGGGAAGPDGIGNNGGGGLNGGQGDNGLGGIGGTSVFGGGTAGAGANNPLGGGGGGGVNGGAGTGGAGGNPGGGGGAGSAVITSTGGRGGNGQITITYTPNTIYLNSYLDPEMFKLFII